MKLLSALIIFIVLISLVQNISASDYNASEPEPYYRYKIGSNIDVHQYTMQGHYYPIYVFLDSIGQTPLKEFNFKIAFDTSALKVERIFPGASIKCWDNFAYSSNTIYDEDLHLWLNVIEISASTDLENNADKELDCEGGDGLFKPPWSDLVEFKFFILPNEFYIGKIVPIFFYWEECDDNIILYGSQTNYVSKRVFNLQYAISDLYYELIPPVRRNYDSDKLYGYEVFCKDEKENHEESIDFYNGGIKTSYCIHDNRGDLDLNDEANTIKDLLLFSEYFIRDESVFTINEGNQVRASDTNNDGIVLTIADYVYLARILSGDAVPYSKLGYLTDSAFISIENDTVFVISDVDLGAFTFSCLADCDYSLLLDDRYTINSDKLDGCSHFLVTDYNNLSAIPSGKTAIMYLNCKASIEYFEAAGYFGDMLHCRISN